MGGVPDINTDDFVFTVGAVRIGAETGLVPIESAADQSRSALVSGLAAATEEAVRAKIGQLRFFIALADGMRSRKWRCRYEPRVLTLLVVGIRLDSASR